MSTLFDFIKSFYVYQPSVRFLLHCSLPLFSTIISLVVISLLVSLLVNQALFLELLYKSSIASISWPITSPNHLIFFLLSKLIQILTVFEEISSHTFSIAFYPVHSIYRFFVTLHFKVVTLCNESEPSIQDLQL